MHVLIVDTSYKLQCSSERVIRDAYEYAELPKSNQAIMLILKWCYLNDTITDEIEQYCLDVLANKVQPLDWKGDRNEDLPNAT